MTSPAPIDDRVPVAVRVGVAADVRFVVSSWVAAMRGVYPNRYVHDYWPRACESVRARIDRANTLIAYFEDYPDDIVSYLVFARRGGLVIAHYAYTKDLARRQGHVSMLLGLANPERLPLIFTQPAKNENVMAHFCRKAIFDPSMWSEA